MTELEERLPSLRVYFYKKFHMLTRHYGRVSQVIGFQNTRFENKVKAVKDAKLKYSNVIEEYQVMR